MGSGDNILHIDIHETQPWPSELSWLNSYTGTLYAAASLMVAQRLLLRTFRLGTPLGLDDALIFAAWIGATGFFVEATLAMNSLDYGVPVQPSKNEFVTFMLWLIEITFTFSQCCIKLAVLAILNRFVKATSDTRIRYAIYAAGTFTAFSLPTLCATSFGACRPSFTAYWRAMNASYAANHDVRCINKFALAIVSGVVVIFQDLYTIAIPWAITRSFGLNKRQTLALNLVFMLGLIVTAASCVRVSTLKCRRPAWCEVFSEPGLPPYQII